MANVTIEPMEHTAALPAAVMEGPDLESIYRAYATSVAHWAARLAGPALDVEDIVQEVFLIAHQRLAKFRGDSSLATWLFGITERVIWHRRRKERWRRWLGGSAEEVTAKMAAAGPCPHGALETKQATELFYRALEGVAERYRAPLVLFELDDLSGQEIADLKGVRVETVWVWLHRARAQLLKRFVELEGRRR
jgi:RNA polymerase sigma-70 factor (ECF subfamily)